MTFWNSSSSGSCIRNFSISFVIYWYIQYLCVNTPSMETSQVLLRLSCFSCDMNYLPTTYLVKCREFGRGGNVQVLMWSAHKGEGKFGGSLTEKKYFCTSALSIQTASFLVKNKRGGSQASQLACTEHSNKRFCTNSVCKHNYKFKIIQQGWHY